YLKSLYRIYGDWHLAIAAYNCGSGTLNKAIARSGGKRDFWAIYPYLPKQTRAYVPAFIAANYIMNYYEEHHICPAHVSLPYQTDTVMTARRIHLQQIADVLGMEKDEVRLLNPQYRRDVIPGGASYSVCLPADLAPMFIAKEEEICAYKNDSLIARRALVEPVGNANTKGRSGTSKGNSTVYVVKKGDSLSKIAKQYHVTVSQLRKWNNCSNNLRIGQKIRILK
ncbi:MAG: LysM peptidoglycan-binding domain-containing protein, partial [Paludibacteraceae bacterium]|nr:LysM peptidoglycan-binding domain-containing protein [Paludibacteraceae bacterium]